MNRIDKENFGFDLNSSCSKRRSIPGGGGVGGGCPKKIKGTKKF